MERLFARALGVSKGLRDFPVSRALRGLVLPLLSVLVGVMGAYVALAFRELVVLGHWIIYKGHLDYFSSRFPTLVWWHVFVALGLGGLLVGWLNVTFFNGHRAQGIGHLIKRSSLFGGEIGVKRGLMSALSSGFSIGIGASVGREGSILHFTATLSSWLLKLCRLPKEHTHTLLGCGIASAMAASFNAPIAGVFFSMEVVMRHYAMKSLSFVVVSSVIGTMIARLHFGDFPAYSIPQHLIATYKEVPAFLLLGLLSAFLGFVFIKSLFVVEDSWKKLPLIPPWLRPSLGGMAVGGLAFLAPRIMGVGYETLTAAMNNALHLGMMALLLLVFLKILATALCIGSGFGGGVFSPSMFIGVIFGQAFGGVVAALFPGTPIDPGLYALVGMASTSAVILGAPITVTLIVFELVGDFTLTVSVMSGVAAASFLMHAMNKRSVYYEQIHREGIHLDEERAQHILRGLSLRELLSKNISTLDKAMSVKDALSVLHTLPEGTDAVIVEDGFHFVGTVSLSDLKDVAFDPLAYVEGTEIQMLCHTYSTLLMVDMSVAQALEHFKTTQESKLPVLDTQEAHNILGIVHKNDLLLAQVRAFKQANSEQQNHMAYQSARE